MTKLLMVCSATLGSLMSIFKGYLLGLPLELFKRMRQRRHHGEDGALEVEHAEVKRHQVFLYLLVPHILRTRLKRLLHRFNPTPHYELGYYDEFLPHKRRKGEEKIGFQASL